MPLTDAEVIKKARKVQDDLPGAILTNTVTYLALLDVLAADAGGDECSHCLSLDGKHYQSCFVGIAIAALRRELGE